MSFEQLPDELLLMVCSYLRVHPPSFFCQKLDSEFDTWDDSPWCRLQLETSLDPTDPTSVEEFNLQNSISSETSDKKFSYFSCSEKTRFSRLWKGFWYEGVVRSS